MVVDQSAKDSVNNAIARLKQANDHTNPQNFLTILTDVLEEINNAMSCVLES